MTKKITKVQILSGSGLTTLPLNKSSFRKKEHVIIRNLNRKYANSNSRQFFKKNGQNVSTLSTLKFARNGTCLIKNGDVFFSNSYTINQKQPTCRRKFLIVNFRYRSDVEFCCGDGIGVNGRPEERRPGRFFEASLTFSSKESFFFLAQQPHNGVPLLITI